MGPLECLLKFLRFYPPPVHVGVCVAILVPQDVQRREYPPAPKIVSQAAEAYPGQNDISAGPSILSVPKPLVAIGGVY